MKRTIGYDYIRIMACFMVILNHTPIYNALFMLGEGLTGTSLIGGFLFNACRMNVVSFILLSGALLLKKEESYKNWFFKRIVRIVVVILLFSTIYYNWSQGNIINYFIMVFSNNLTNAYWFLYVYLGLMLLTPLLRKFCISASKEDFLLLAILFLVTQSIYPILVYYFRFPSFQYMFSQMYSYWVSWIMVFLFGNYFDKLIAQQGFRTKSIPLMLIIWGIGNTIPTFIAYFDLYYRKDNNLFIDNPVLIWSLIATLSLDLTLINIGNKTENNKYISRIVRNISSLTFGIYLFSDKLILTLEPFYKNLSKNIIVNALLLAISVFILGAVITFLLKQIPLLKKLL